MLVPFQLPLVDVYAAASVGSAPEARPPPFRLLPVVWQKNSVYAMAHPSERAATVDLDRTHRVGHTHGPPAAHRGGGTALVPGDVVLAPSNNVVDIRVL